MQHCKVLPFTQAQRENSSFMHKDNGGGSLQSKINKLFSKSPFQMMTKNLTQECVHLSFGSRPYHPHMLLLLEDLRGKYRQFPLMFFKCKQIVTQLGRISHLFPDIL